VVNLVAAVIALAALRWAGKPADEQHTYGHAKAEYFSAGIEGALIFLAAVTIAVTAVDRLMHPQPLSDVGIGLVVSVAASAINLGVGTMLVRTGREHRSITLEADGRHLLTDVWTSIGVVVGVAAVAVSGWDRLDAIVALAVAANIVFTGATLLRRSAAGLMDRALPDDLQREITQALAAFDDTGVQFHALRTRQAGQRAFISLPRSRARRLDRAPGPRHRRAGRVRTPQASPLRDRLHPRRADRRPTILRRHRARPHDARSLTPMTQCVPAWSMYSGTIRGQNSGEIRANVAIQPRLMTPPIRPICSQNPG
jgi:cation diffusion facilitator family transporter